MNDVLHQLFSGTGDNNLPRKDAAMSIEARKRGNLLYSGADHSVKTHCRILYMYTQSAALAHQGSEELALAYGNRSALLMHLGKYAECLVDVERASRATRSDKLRLKLADRRDKCLPLAKDVDRAEPSSKKIEMQSSESVPCASELVALRFDEKYGRHVVAVEDIEPGTVVAVERGFLFPKGHKKFLNCSHCLNFAWNGVPCETCAVVVYCSEKCKNEAWLRYHDVECSVLPLLTYLNNDDERMTNFMLTMRVFITLVKEEGLASIVQQANRIDTDEDVPLDEFFDKGLFQSNKFKTVYNLSRAPDFEIQGQKLFFSMIINLLHTKTNIFDSNIEIDDCVKESINEILKKLSNIVNNNVYAFDYVKRDGTLYTGSNLRSKYRIGETVTSFCSFFNHSCDANVARTFCDGQILMYATDHIKQGQQLFVTYGPDTSIKVDERKKYIQGGYNFDCDCYPCQRNWSIDVYDRKESHDEVVVKIASEFIKIGTQETFLALSNPSQIAPVSEKFLNDVKKMIKVANEHCDRLNAIVIKIMLKSYIDTYIANTYGVKLEVPDTC